MVDLETDNVLILPEMLHLVMSMVPRGCVSHSSGRIETLSVPKSTIFLQTMKILTLLFTFIIVKADRVLDDSIYKPESLLYTANDNIVDIDIHFYTPNDDTVFLVEKDNNGSFKGIFALETAKNDTLIATKVLDNGRCTTSDDKTVFFGATDGIYTYNFAEKKPEKYGNITAEIKAIQKDSKHDVIYIIADNQLSKVTEMGTKMQKITNEVQEVVLDKDDNVYFYERYIKKPKVLVNGEVKVVNGLPKYSQIKLIRNFPSAEGVLLMLNKKLYRIFPNGTSAATEYVFDKVPTAFYFEFGVIQLFGYHKELYQFNILETLLKGLSSAISDFYSTTYSKA